MAQLSLSFLGPFSVRLGNKPITKFESDKVRALLAYLAVEAGKPHRRSGLAGLLWPDYPESAARASLRNALANLRQIIQDQKAQLPFLSIDRETIQFNLSSDHWLDVSAFEELAVLSTPELSPSVERLKIENLKSAVSLYRGPFLQGFSLKDSSSFDEWVLLVRENLHRKVVSTLSCMVQEFERCDHPDQACAYAFRLVALEPWHEETHRQLMRLLAANGRRAAALVQYEACRRSLWEELGVQPDAETIQLYKHIRDGEIQGTAGQKPSLHNLPGMLSQLIGREAELNELLAHLEDPDCRLLTVVGPGGCGKTRLTLEAAFRMVDCFQHGVYLVALAGIQAPQAIPRALAHALDFPFRPEGNPWDQILDYLRQKQMLLVLDNFEHLLEGTGLVVELLLADPGVKILVTSRVRLNVMEERLLPLGGLRYPEAVQPSSMTADPAVYPALRLFLEGARRVQPAFRPGMKDMEQIGAICRLVAGLPLAVLLAASWAELLTPAEIAIHIQQSSLEFLQTDWRDVPERQRSLRLVFDHSWKLLTSQQQGTLAGLSIFPDSFTFLAARAVTQIELPELRELVERSLVQPASAERFELHMLMRQYASEKLDESPTQRDEFHNQHCAFFMELLARWATALQGSGQREAQNEITREGENIHLAWEWALDHAQFDRLAQGLDGLGNRYERLCLYQEGERIFQNAAAQVNLGPSKPISNYLLVRVLGWQSFFSRMLGNNTAAHQAIDQAMQLLESLNLQQEDICEEKAYLLQQRGLLVFNTHRHQAQQDLLESREMYRQVGNTWREAQVLTNLAMVTSAFGHYQKAEGFLQESLALQRALGDYIGMANTLKELSTTLAEFGDFDKMAVFIKEHAIILRELGSPAQQADNLFLESVNMCYLGRFAESALLMEEILGIYEHLGSQSLCMHLRCLYGWIEVNEGLYEQGWKNYHISLAMARQLGLTYGLALNLLGIGEIYLFQEEYEQARQVLEESISLYSQAVQEDELSIALVCLATIEHYLDLLPQARSHHYQAIRIAAKIRSWQASLHVVGRTALILTLQGKVEQGVELYALATRYPYLGNSRYWEDTAGKRIAELASGLPEEVVTAAQERGRARDLDKTVKELFAELS